MSRRASVVEPKRAALPMQPLLRRRDRPPSNMNVDRHAARRIPFQTRPPSRDDQLLLDVDHFNGIGHLPSTEHVSGDPQPVGGGLARELGEAHTTRAQGVKPHFKGCRRVLPASHRWVPFVVACRAFARLRARRCLVGLEGARGRLRCLSAPSPRLPTVTRSRWRYPTPSTSKRALATEAGASCSP